jgi:hypothetical protein
VEQNRFQWVPSQLNADRLIERQRRFHQSRQYQRGTETHLYFHRTKQAEKFTMQTASRLVPPRQKSTGSNAIADAAETNHARHGRKLECGKETDRTEATFRCWPVSTMASESLRDGTQRGGVRLWFLGPRG